MNDISPGELPECTQALLDVLSPEEDLRLYAQVEEGRRENEQRRKEEMEELQQHAKVLSQTLSQLRATSTRDAAGWKASDEHADEMERLQAQNFSLVKRINEQEARLRSLEADVSTFERELAAMEEEDVESQEEMDKDAIAVGLFRKMGFVPCYIKQDGTQDAHDVFHSLMVRSETKNRSTEFDVDDEMMRNKGITPFILANQLWMASE